ncbi:hypothetical protein R69619_07262 [Paraburkholderia nemoris]|uniref:lasso peptide biosynthesis protein n=1 Tax=Paraburkholderia nemoris TaxID=2793076 RepID=UPI00190E17BD|nr:lasso peptide biosynthesis protein [Paraburkholderia nemoris]MBK3744721.1 hypothetical protein [Paraburkholderia aspalathi]CAE6846817.1 hypothetical protein R69619_07262 [Paraburkholderia nemoris]
MKIDAVRANIFAWFDSAQALAPKTTRGESTADAFCSTLSGLVENQATGGCHEYAAVMHLLLAEAGVESTLCIGVVKAAGTFDHSWVEIDDLIFDAAVCLPNLGGHEAGPPVFASLNLSTGQRTNLVYGVPLSALDDVAAMVAGLNLDEYSPFVHPARVSLWAYTAELGLRFGLDLDPEALRSKYGATKRVPKGLRAVVEE